MRVEQSRGEQRAYLGATAVSISSGRPFRETTSPAGWGSGCATASFSTALAAGFVSVPVQAERPLALVQNSLVLRDGSECDMHVRTVDGEAARGDFFAGDVVVADASASTSTSDASLCFSVPAAAGRSRASAFGESALAAAEAEAVTALAAAEAVNRSEGAVFGEAAAGCFDLGVSNGGLVGK